MESRLLPNIIWEQEVKSKKSGKKSFLQKLIYLANAFQNPIQILLLDKLTVWNIRDITFLEFASSRIWENSFNQIKQFRHLTDIILIPQNFKSTGESSNLQNCRSMRFPRKYISSTPFPELFVLPERRLPLLIWE